MIQNILSATLAGLMLLPGAAAPVMAGEPSAPQSSQATGEERFTMERKNLVEELRREGIKDEAVLAAIGAVPRHRFVGDSQAGEAYGNYPLPIGHGQTISQPYVVAFMTEAAKLRPGANVLEVGTGSGYQCAVLAQVLGLGPGGAGMGHLASMEIITPLALQAKKLLPDLGYRADLREGDGYSGWPEKAPFDAILVTAAPDHVPQPLKDQLAIGGRLVVPVGETEQRLLVITRTEKGYREETILPVRFVPMTGEAKGRR